MLYQALAIVIAGLIETITILAYRYKMSALNSDLQTLRNQCDMERARADAAEASTKDNVSRFEKIISDLKTDIEQRTKALYEAFQNNPALAGSILAGVLSCSNDPNTVGSGDLPAPTPTPLGTSKRAPIR